ncbi:MAG: hypothetical protein LBF02_01245 [Mycoplasmataceae bacterium]|jgi:hypothetical protein|nr:hypothetical protein [Mycoplasmataceae bacterium]
MVINNKTSNSNKEQKSKCTDSSNSIINKKMGKERNFIVNRTSSNIFKQGTDFSAIEYTYSRRTPKLDIINEILKRLEKIDLKLDNIDERITNIESVQKIQGEKLDRLENKVNNIIVLNNLKTE